MNIYVLFQMGLFPYKTVGFATVLCGQVWISHQTFGFLTFQDNVLEAFLIWGWSFSGVLGTFQKVFGTLSHDFREVF